MKRLLLIGSLDENTKNIYQCLMNYFQVQLCFGELDTIKSIYQIVNPNMVILNQVETKEAEPAMLEWLQSCASRMPVLFVTVEERWEKYRSYWENSLADKIFRPVTKDELIKKCYQMFQMECPVLRTEASGMDQKIMIVDDSPLVLRSLKTLLGAKYTVYLATSGEQALTLIPKKKPDLILMDYEMPGLNGKKTYEMLKQQEDTKDIPVIFLTSVSSKEHIAAILETNPADYILKPPDQDRLFQSIEHALAGTGSQCP